MASHGLPWEWLGQSHTFKACFIQTVTPRIELSLFLHEFNKVSACLLQSHVTLLCPHVFESKWFLQGEKKRKALMESMVALSLFFHFASRHKFVLFFILIVEPNATYNPWAAFGFHGKHALKVRENMCYQENLHCHTLKRKAFPNHNQCINMRFLSQSMYKHAFEKKAFQSRVWEKLSITINA